MSASNIRTSPKKGRKPQQRSMALRDAISNVAAGYDRLTVRQLYYQLVARRVIEKTENEYKRVCDVAVQMRLDGSLDYRKIADGSRSRREPWSFGGLGEALSNTQELYRRNYWIDQPTHVEVWCEKDALTGVIEPVCREYGVPYVATRGFPSLTLIYESAQAMIEVGKPTNLFYFGDHDASGQTISRNLEESLRSHGADVRVHRMALEPWQIDQYRLPTRPGKRSDSRHAKFAARYGDASVELDALPPNLLVDLIRAVISEQVDIGAWNRARAIEAQERVTLESIAGVRWEAGRVYALTPDVEA